MQRVAAGGRARAIARVATSKRRRAAGAVKQAARRRRAGADGNARSRPGVAAPSVLVACRAGRTVRVVEALRDADVRADALGVAPVTAGAVGVGRARRGALVVRDPIGRVAAAGLPLCAAAAVLTDGSDATGEVRGRSAGSSTTSVRGCAAPSEGWGGEPEYDECSRPESGGSAGQRRHAVYRDTHDFPLGVSWMLGTCPHGGRGSQTVPLLDVERRLLCFMSSLSERPSCALREIDIAPTGSAEGMPSAVWPKRSRRGIRWRPPLRSSA